jgi:hypothetical protein
LILLHKKNKNLIVHRLKSEAPRLKGRASKRNNFINDYSTYIFPPLVKGGQGGFINVIIIKSPLIPLGNEPTRLFQRGKPKRRTFHPRLKNGVFKFSFQKKNVYKICVICGYNFLKCPQKDELREKNIIMSC